MGFARPSPRRGARGCCWRRRASASSGHPAAMSAADGDSRATRPFSLEPCVLLLLACLAKLNFTYRLSAGDHSMISCSVRLERIISTLVIETSTPGPLLFPKSFSILWRAVKRRSFFLRCAKYLALERAVEEIAKVPRSFCFKMRWEGSEIGASSLLLYYLPSGAVREPLAQFGKI